MSLDMTHRVMTFNLIRLPLPWSMCIKWPFPTLTKASAWKTWKALLFFLSPNSHYTCIFNHTHPSPPFLLVACNTVYTVVKCNGHQCFCLLNRKKNWLYCSHIVAFLHWLCLCRISTQEACASSYKHKYTHAIYRQQSSFFCLLCLPHSL